MLYLISVKDDLNERPLEDPNLFQGDIVLPEMVGRNGVPNDAQKWPNGVIPYEIHNTKSETTDIINKAIQHYNEHTCIRFKPRTNQKDYVVFNLNDHTGCNSMVGRTTGSQEINLGNGCNTMRHVVHEMMHAIGFWHEHSRSDRDKYVQIHYENVKEEYLHDFKALQPEGNRLFTTFDFDSVMLYGPTAFSKNGQVTMSSKIAGKHVKNPPKDQTLSPYDIESINKLYQCKQH